MKKGYKVTDSNMACRGYQFKLNKWFHTEGEIRACENGFHWCENLADCFNYYSFDPNNRVFEIEVKGMTVNEDDKCASRSVRLIRELSWEEVLRLVNTGNYNSGYRNSGDSNSGDWNSGYRNSGNSNSGYRNSGDRNSGDGNSGDRNSGHRNSGNYNSGNSNSGNSNSGDRNSGHRNSGHRNSGNWNSGNWNSCDRESGFLNSSESEDIRVFNKYCSHREWQLAKKPVFLYFDLTSYKDDELITMDYKQAFKESYDSLSPDQRIEQTKQLKALPNFDAEVFYEISGIKID